MWQVLSMLSSRGGAVVAGLVALIVIIWFGGPYLRFGAAGNAPFASVEVRVLLIIVVIALWGLNQLRVKWMAKRRNDKLIADMQNMPGDSAAGGDQAAEELSIMNKRFGDAVAVLKNSRLGGSKGQKALYDLPWYIIIGPPGSGKTTALINSGLEFPLSDQFGKGAIGGVGGTRNCDWWFSNEAVLIDTAGRYTTQDSHKVVDSTAWNGFLDLLARHRKRRPINGAIVAVSIQDVLTQTADERVYHARTIRARIDELVAQLGIHFPIYFVFTKCDLIAGFSEFFEELGLEQREQVWGVTFPVIDPLSKSNAYDGQYFAQKYGELISRLHHRVLERAQRERDAKRRAAIFNFPYQFEALQNNIDDFLKQTFAPNRFQEQPFLRGVYFSSGTQEGTPIDRMMNAVAGNFGLPASVVSLPGSQGKSFFINRLFKSVIFPEAELVGSNRKYEQFLLWLRRGTYATLGILFLISIAIWTSAYSRNKTYLEQVAEHGDRFTRLAANIHVSDRDLRHIIPALTELRAASRVYDQESLPWLVGLGLHDARVDRAAKNAYATQLQKMLLPRLAARLEDYLRNASFKDPLLHDTLLAYLMLGDTERLQADAIRNWMVADWQEVFRGQDEVQAALSEHLNALLASQFDSIELHPEVLSAARSELRKVPVAKRIYNRIKSEPDHSRIVDLSEVLGDAVRAVYTIPRDGAPLRMPVMFTKEGYERVDLSASSPIIRDMFKDRWIMDDSDSKVYNDNELEKIREQVKDLYHEEYISRWRAFLEAFSLTGISDLDAARRVSARLADPVLSPALSVLKVVQANTQLTPDVPDVVPEKADGALSRLFGGGSEDNGEAALLEGTRVDQFFRDVNQLIKARGDNPPRINSAISAFNDIHDYLNKIMLSPDASEAAFQAARSRLASAGDDAIKMLRIEAGRLPEPVQGWMLKMADESWRLILGRAKSHVNQQWANTVYRRFSSNLAGRFPLNRNAVDELAVFDFSEFFKPEGVHDLFVKEFIDPFVNIDASWTIKRLDGRGLYLTDEAITQFRRAAQIRDMLFRTTPTSPSFNFTMRPHQMDASVRKFELVFGGQRLTYEHGPSIPRKLSWPGDGSGGARMVFEDLNDSIKRVSFDGPWAFLRLLQESEINPTRQSNVYRVTFSSLGRKSTWEVTAQSANNPFRDQVIAQYRAPESL